MRAIVVLPDPDSPTSPSEPPAARSNVTSSAATVAPKDLRSSRTDNI